MLHGVDFSIGAGEVVALMGRNGMGKTTLLRSMLGLIKPRAGDVRIDGTPAHATWRRTASRGSGIAFVPEGRGIFPDSDRAREPADGGAAGRTAARLDAGPRARDLSALAERLGHGGNQLSGGEQQMLTIGRALMTNPRLLILDEATEGLAPLIARDDLADDTHDPRRRHRDGDRRQEFRRCWPSSPTAA